MAKLGVMLQAQGLDKQFAAKVLFAALDWQIEAGERIGLVGANGAGKTTLLRILAEQEQADAGRVTRTGGESMAYLPQEPPRAHEGSVRQRVEGGAEQVQRLGRELERLTAAMAQAKADEVAPIAHAFDHAQQQFAMAGGYALAGRAEAILLGLGFAKDALDAPVAQLSGGWWMRTELARLLVAAPDYLLMDEPTNHLDAPSLAWLEDFLRGYAGSWVVVSHDRYFLNRCVDSIVELGDGKLARYPGNYDAFVAAQALQQEQALAASQAHARKKAHLESFVDRFGAKASKARQAQSRVKQLERLEPPPAPRRRQRHMALRLAPPARSGQRVAHLAGASVRLGTRTLFRGVHLTIERGQKVAILGANGAGKSTLLKMVAGLLPLAAGERQLGHNVAPYYFAQHQLDMLDGSATVLEEVSRAMPTATVGEVRGLLGAFLFDNDAVARRVAALSGGEKARLALAKMLAQPANFLLLDEPTNHLDLTSREVLEAALANYAGTVLFVSHDRYFVDRLATQVLEVPGDGTLLAFNGGWAAWREAARKREAATRQAERSPPAAPAPKVQAAVQPSSAHKENYAATKAARQAERKRQAAIAQAEQRVAQAEAQLAQLDAELALPEVFADGPRAGALLRQRQHLADDALPTLLAQWEALHGPPVAAD